MHLFPKTTHYIYEEVLKRGIKDTEALRLHLIMTLSAFSTDCDTNLIYGPYNRNALVIRTILINKQKVVMRNNENLMMKDYINFFTSLLNFLQKDFNEFFILEFTKDAKLASVSARELGITYEDFIKFCHL